VFRHGARVLRSGTFAWSSLSFPEIVLERLTPIGALHAVRLMMAVWWVWIFTSWLWSGSAGDAGLSVGIDAATDLQYGDDRRADCGGRAGGDIAPRRAPSGRRAPMARAGSHAASHRGLAAGKVCDDHLRFLRCVTRVRRFQILS
jgi:hypothetical protein